MVNNYDFDDTRQYMYKSNIVLAFDHNDDIQILIKNRYEWHEGYLSENTALKLISKILVNSIYNNEILEVFSSALQNEIIEKCKEIINKHKVKEK